jgi:transposase-like protein
LVLAILKRAAERTLTIMAASHAPYPPAFRAEAIRLARESGLPRTEIARWLEITTETLRMWVR